MQITLPFFAFVSLSVTSYATVTDMEQPAHLSGYVADGNEMTLATTADLTEGTADYIHE